MLSPHVPLLNPPCQELGLGRANFANANLEALSALTSLSLLDLQMCSLRAVPQSISALTGLRVL